MTKAQAIKRAKEINNMLSKLQNKTHELLSSMDKENMELYPHMKDLIVALQDLESFDLEDSIVTAYDYECL